MMTITRISRLHNCGVFQNFSWPTDLPDFGQYNIIYGWNWTGKTTLSRLFRDIERQRPPTTGEIGFCIDGVDVCGKDFEKTTLQIRVFNRDFIEENVFPVGGGDLPPIFVLGAENVEKQKEVERLKGDRATAHSELKSARTMKQKTESDFEQFCSERAKTIKDLLRSSGQNPYNNYSKSNFKSDAQKMAVASDGADHRISDAERQKLIAQHQSNSKPKVQEVQYALPDFEPIVSSLSQLMTTTVVSVAIEALKGDSTLSGWTKQGLELHRNRQAERCLFCEQPLPKDRFTALEAHFSTQYEQFMQRLDRFIDRLQVLSKAAVEIHLPNKAELYDDLAADFQAAETGLRKALGTVRSFFDTSVKVLLDKKSRPFERLRLELKAPLLDAEAVDKLNAVIRKHNYVCDNFQSRVNYARKRLAHDMIAAALDDFVCREGAVLQATADVQTKEQLIQRLDDKVDLLEREIVERRQPVEELNDDLRKYLGHNELRLDIKETGYSITRGSVPAKLLSEGEMTAIALLYFLKSLQDMRFNLADGIVVLDDPVSSLDANALFLAFGYIRERTQGARQLIILTHNFSLFRQVRNWFHHLNGRKKGDISRRPARFFMLDCAQNENGRCAAIRWLDPLLEQYDSEYHYLFARVYRASTETGSTCLEENYILPNIARRMLEAFLAFRQPQVSGELWQKIRGLPFDEARKLRIIRFLHTYSHSTAVGESEHDLSVLAECPAVLKDLLELIQSEDTSHYSAMVQLLTFPAGSVEDRGELTTA